MALRILLASDLHIGMRFVEYPAIQARLAAERLACLGRIVEEAGRRRCDLLVIAGDLFHRVNVPKRDITAAAETLRAFSGAMVVVLPGNHDFLSADDELWPRFREAAGGGVLVLQRPQPYPLSAYDLDACLYPGPCGSIHSKQNAIGWVRGVSRDPGVAHHIGIAHGSLEGISPDFNGDYYPMRSAELLETGLDLWLLGHTHLRYPDTPGKTDKIYLPGVPEPDGFDCTHEGYCWDITLADDSSVAAEPVRTGGFRFVEDRVEVRGPQELDALEARYAGPEAGTILLRARLSGRVSRETLSAVGPLGTRMADRLLHLDLHTEDLLEEITQQSIDRDYSQGSFPHLLLSRLVQSDDLEGLQIALELLEEVRG